MDAEEILKWYAAGKRNFSRVDLSKGVTLEEAYLIEINLSKANLYSIDLHHSDLSNADLKSTNLEKADLRFTWLTNANLRYANLTGADLTGADLTGADLTGAVLIETNLNGSDLAGTKTEDTLLCRTIMPYGSIESDPKRVISTQEFLKCYTAGNRRFPGIVLHRADLRGQDLRGIILTHHEVLKQLKYPAYLVYANLSGANLEECSLVGVKFRGADLSGANLYRAILRGVDFSYANLRGANLLYAEMEGVNFTGADLTGANVDEQGLYWRTFFRNTTMPDGTVIVEATSYGD